MMQGLTSGWGFFQNEILGMKWLNRLMGSAVKACGLDPAGRVGGSIQFFFYDVIKIMVLLGVDFIDLTAVSIPVELAKYVPRNIAKKYCVVPVKLVRDNLYLAMSDPLDFVAQDEVSCSLRSWYYCLLRSQQIASVPAILCL